MKNTLKIVCYLALVYVFLEIGPLYTEWNPKISLSEKPLDVLQEASYQRLRASILVYLKKSWCSEEKAKLLMDLVVVTKPKVCVEIGAFTGSTVLPVAAMLRYIGGGKIYAIDAWSNSVAIRDLSETDPNRAWWSKVDMMAARRLFFQRLKAFEVQSYCAPLQMHFKKAVVLLPAIDFLHIDGSLSEKGSIEEVSHYLPKVKVGGYILISNLLATIQENQVKLQAFHLLSEACEMVAEIEDDNAILFKKL